MCPRDSLARRKTLCHRYNFFLSSFPLWMLTKWVYFVSGFAIIEVTFKFAPPVFNLKIAVKYIFRRIPCWEQCLGFMLCQNYILIVIFMNRKTCDIFLYEGCVFTFLYTFIFACTIMPYKTILYLEHIQKTIQLSGTQNIFCLDTFYVWSRQKIHNCGHRLPCMKCTIKELEKRTDRPFMLFTEMLNTSMIYISAQYSPFRR